MNRGIIAEISAAADGRPRAVGERQDVARHALQAILRAVFVGAKAPKRQALEKAALVLDRAMLCPNTLRFRDFYNVKLSSEG